eukprot:4195189-Pyramimonas_sp.AAC.1
MQESNGSGLDSGVAKLIGRTPSYQCFQYTELAYGTSTSEMRDFLAHQVEAARHNSLMSAPSQEPPGPGRSRQGRHPERLSERNTGNDEVLTRPHVEEDVFVTGNCNFAQAAATTLDMDIDPFEHINEEPPDTTQGHSSEDQNDTLHNEATATSTDFLDELEQITE